MLWVVVHDLRGLGTLLRRLLRRKRRNRKGYRYLPRMRISR
jgi:hypothetical protein